VDYLATVNPQMLQEEMPMHYCSTRGNSTALSFEDVLLAGLAPDGGLYVPSHLPVFSPKHILEMATLPYAALAQRIIAPFVGDVLSESALRIIIEESYVSFRHVAVTPLTQIHHHEYVLELFHGPTLAFKDVALQFLGRVMESILRVRGEKLVILGATSGDTGSAAIAGCSGREGMDVVILYPHGRVSDVQRRQMTTIADANVHCLAIDGTFDDCQHIVKTLFVDSSFRANYPLGAVNSINWTRIIAQIVYYFYAAFQLGAPARRVAFSVPTGNFGDIYAGYLAKCMGLPIAELIIASNSNDILTRCLNTGRYEVRNVVQTLSPSMDIGVSSNFERLLYNAYGEDAEAVSVLMHALKTTGGFDIAPQPLARIHKDFAALCVDDAQTSQTIRAVYEQTGMLIDPHTAIGVAAVRSRPKHSETAYVTLATAHAAKFPDAVQVATGQHPALPAHLADLFDRPERFTRMANDAEAVKAFITKIYE
jgi:threonine synthase